MEALRLGEETAFTWKPCEKENNKPWVIENFIINSTGMTIGLLETMFLNRIQNAVSIFSSIWKEKHTQLQAHRHQSGSITLIVNGEAPC